MKRPAQAAAYGLAVGADDSVQQTSIWCPECGRQRLVGWLRPELGRLALRCPHCCYEPGMSICRHDESIDLLKGVRGFKLAYRRAMEWGHRYYRQALACFPSDTAPCWKCGHPAPLELRLPHTPHISPSLRGERGVHVRCPACGGQAYTSLRALVLHQPQTRRFWLSHGRIRWLPPRDILFEGRAAILTAFASIDGSATFEVICKRDTFAPISINGECYDECDAGADPH